MRRAFALLLVAGCRQIFGIEDPRAFAIDAPAAVVPMDGAIDASCSDSDGDGICDAVDDWPCGLKPAIPGTLDETDNGNLTDLQIAGFNFAATTTKFAVVAPGDPLLAKFMYTWHDTSCPSDCIDQIEIGFAPGDRVGCPFDQDVQKGTAVAGTTSYGLTAPLQAGLVSVRFAIGQNESCNYQGAHTWFLGPPPATDIAGYICVH